MKEWYDFIKFSEKLHEIEKKKGQRGGGRGEGKGHPPLYLHLEFSKYSFDIYWSWLMAETHFT